MGTTGTSIALALATLVLVTGCQDDGGSASPPSDGDSTPASTEPTESGSPDATEPSAEPVEPASGPLVKVGTFTVRAPEGWRIMATGPFAEVGKIPQGGGSTFKEVHGLIYPESFPSIKARTLEQEARENRDGRRVDDVVLDGEPAYHYVSPEAPGYLTESFGLNHDFESVNISFALFGGSKQDRQDLVASVLATWQWR